MRTRIAAAVVLLSMAGGSARAAEAFKVIVNARMTGRGVGRETLAQIYLGRAERWSDGHPIVAVDLSTTSPVRESFSQGVLGMSVMAVRQQWTRSMSTGHMPPVTKTSDEDIIAFVGSRTGAVGYVSAEALLPDTVRVVAVQ